MSEFPPTVLTADERNTLKRLGTNVNPAHANIVRAYVRGRPTRSLSNQEFRFLGNFRFSLLQFIFNTIRLKMRMFSLHFP